MITKHQFALHLIAPPSTEPRVQFGPGDMQQHGFARNVDWEVASTSADLQPDERDASIEFVLQPSDYSTKMFPYKFKVVYTVTLHGTQLQTDYRCAAAPAGCVGKGALSRHGVRG